MDWADRIAARCVGDGMGDGDTRRLIAEALRAEREACEQIAEDYAQRAFAADPIAQEAGVAARNLAAAIRARNN